MTQTQTGAQPLVITRVLNAPRELVFKVWTQAEHLAKWWGPAGDAITVNKLDLRPGGMFLYSMTAKTGFVMYGRFSYREITPPEKIVFTNAFADAEGNIVRAPFSALFPLEILNTLVLTEAGGKTTLTLTGFPLNATEEEINFFTSMYSGMQQGFGATFAQLEAYLTQIV